MSTPTVRLHRWDEIALEKVTEMISRKMVTGEREMIGADLPEEGRARAHALTRERADDLRPAGRAEVPRRRRRNHAARRARCCTFPSWVEHQAEALDDTFELDLFSPIRQDWLDHTDEYFHNEPSASRGVRGARRSSAAVFDRTAA